MLFIAGDNNPFMGTSLQVGDRSPSSAIWQVFINSVDNLGTMKVTVLNVSGCGNAPTGTAVQEQRHPCPFASSVRHNTNEASPQTDEHVPLGEQNTNKT
jgi:hypothetical protein